MIFRELALSGAWLIEPERLTDERGFFARTFCEDEFARRGLCTRFIQSSIAGNAHTGTLRGMHYQIEPKAEVKLVRCTRGAVYDVIVDLRPQSPTLHQWTAVELSAANAHTLYIPTGLAHGYQTLSPDTELVYAMSETYAPELARGVRWDDRAFAIRWPAVAARIIAPKDSSWPDVETPRRA